MNKFSVGVALTVLLAAQIASAQTYFNNPTFPAPYSGACVQITRDLSVGSRGNDVLNVQKFIVSRNYPGSGNWLMSGYYGAATRAGVMNFQIDMRLPQTGVLDANTRASLSSFTCGTTHNPPTVYPTPIDPWYNNPNYNPGTFNGNCGVIYNPSNCGGCTWYNPNSTSYNPCSNPAYNPASITNVSGPGLIVTGVTGTWTLTLYAPNASDNTNISVHWGENYSSATQSQQISGQGSKTVTLTHVYYQPGTYTIIFTANTSSGQSSTITRTVQVTGSPVNVTPYITSISPTSGRVGTVIQINGTGFTGDNTVHFGNGGKMHVSSMSGNYIYFTVPATVSSCDTALFGGYCAQYIQTVTPGQYQIYVTASGLTGPGVNSNSVTFTVQ